MSFLDFFFALSLNNSGKMDDDKTHFKSNEKKKKGKCTKFLSIKGFLKHTKESESFLKFVINYFPSSVPLFFVVSVQFWKLKNLLMVFTFKWYKDT